MEDPNHAKKGDSAGTLGWLMLISILSTIIGACSSVTMWPEVGKAFGGSPSGGGAQMLVFIVLGPIFLGFIALTAAGILGSILTAIGLKRISKEKINIEGEVPKIEFTTVSPKPPWSVGRKIIGCVLVGLVFFGAALANTSHASGLIISGIGVAIAGVVGLLALSYR